MPERPYNVSVHEKQKRAKSIELPQKMHEAQRLPTRRHTSILEIHRYRTKAFDHMQNQLWP